MKYQKYRKNNQNKKMQALSIAAMTALGSMNPSLLNNKAYAAEDWNTTGRNEYLNYKFINSQENVKYLKSRIQWIDFGDKEATITGLGVD